MKKHVFLTLLAIVMGAETAQSDERRAPVVREEFTASQGIFRDGDDSGLCFSSELFFSSEGRYLYGISGHPGDSYNTAFDSQVLTSVPVDCLKSASSEACNGVKIVFNNNITSVVNNSDETIIALDVTGSLLEVSLASGSLVNRVDLDLPMNLVAMLRLSGNWHSVDINKISEMITSTEMVGSFCLTPTLTG
jgi:hypothetical protein